MDIGKATRLAIIPIIVIVAGGLFTSIIAMVPMLKSLICVIGPMVLLVNIGVLVWAGYNSVKSAGFDISGAALTGAIAGGFASLINSIIGIVINLVAKMLGFGITTTIGKDITTQLFGTINEAIFIGVAALLCIPAGIIFWAIVGAILGVIGGFIAGKK